MSSVAFTLKPIQAVTGKENFYILKSIPLRSKIHAVLVNCVFHETIHPTRKFLRCEIISASRKFSINAFFLARDIMNVSILKIFGKFSDAWD